MKLGIAGDFGLIQDSTNIVNRKPQIARDHTAGPNQGPRKK